MQQKTYSWFFLQGNNKDELELHYSNKKFNCNLLGAFVFINFLKFIVIFETGGIIIILINHKFIKRDLTLNIFHLCLLVHEFLVILHF